MLTRKQQGVYRPVVSKAWTEHCRLTETAPNNKPAYDAWYRDQVHSSIGVWSTKEADPVRDFQRLLYRFKLIAGEPQPIVIQGWTCSQNSWFEREARKAYDVEISRGATDIEFRTWVGEVLIECSIHDHTAVDHLKAFDRVMSLLGTISGDEVLIGHFSASSEIRIRWQVRRYMVDLSFLEKRPVEWSYVQAIWKQSNLLPDLDEAPSATLVKVMQMLDTHIRRLCKTAGIKPKCLPQRCTCSCRDKDCPEGYPIPTK